jgi:alpha-amylase/alpha-mannosidase (GH57 family)
LRREAAEELSEAEREFVLRYFFQANPDHLIYRYPRYGELFNVWKSCGANPPGARRHFSVQDLRDLQVLSQVAWFDEEFQAHDEEVKALIAKGRDYSLDDQALMARKEREILGHVMPVYKEFAARGQIEIATTPFYHPILPLICDSDIAGVSHPGVTLPSRFQYPQDALHQLKRAREFMERQFGRAPVGCGLRKARCPMKRCRWRPKRVSSGPRATTEFWREPSIRMAGRR